MRAVLFVLCVVALGCGNGAKPDPFAGRGPPVGGGGEGGAEAGAAGADNGPPPLDGGQACVDDAECDDGFDCTMDACDARAGRCRHDPVDALCDDGVFCNGKEVCNPSLGCQPGGVESCSDNYTCTIDTCIEATQSCHHEPRDADGDGDPPVSCNGTDCDDFNPLVSGKAAEVCGNGIDDDCDGEVDEADCVSPLYDRCSDAFEIDAPGSYSVSTVGAAKDYGITCEGDGGGDAFRDLVLAITVPDDGPRDVDIVATMQHGEHWLDPGELVLAATDHCGKSSGETACVPSGVTESHDAVARLLLRGLAPGPHAVYVAADQEADVELHVDFRSPEPAPANETCGTATPLVPNEPVDVVLAGLTTDLESACDSTTGELVYSFELSKKSDVRLQAAALDDAGDPVVSLRDAACVDVKDELTCRSASPADLFARALPAGSYTVALSGTGPVEAELVLGVSPATDPPKTEGCGDPPALVPGVTENVSLSDATDAVQIGCVTGAPDATYALALDARSDVLLVGNGSSGDTGGVLLAEPPCATDADRELCAAADTWPVRAAAYGVGPGELRATIETRAGNPASLTAFVRPASSSVFVQGADECADAFEIPETGGRFEGNTSNQYAQYDASCDYGGQPKGGAAEQMLALTLTEPRRVIIDASGSSYQTLVVVRHADGCPGSEVAGTCALSYTPNGSDASAYSFIDAVLDPGSYFIQIDGYNGAQGRWVLDVFTSPLGN